MTIPVHVPYDEGLIREVARPDDGTWIRVAQSTFELGCLCDAFIHQTVHLANEGEVVGRVQEERGPNPARPQGLHRIDRAGRGDRIAAGVARFDLAGASQSAERA
jgi:hypothetical protein